MLYDCFPFFNELELLEIRLKLLYDKVDYFIISECDSTFSGLPKAFFFEENKNYFKNYLDKIIHLKHYDTENYIDPVNTIVDVKKRDTLNQIQERLKIMRTKRDTDFGAPHWSRDFYHKELIMTGMDIINKDDHILFGDADEIPNPDYIKCDDNSYVFGQDYYMYFLNNQNTTQSWSGTFLTKFSNLIDNSCMFTRINREKFISIPNSGWHLSFIGDSEKIKQKIKCWSHQEFNHPVILNNVEKKLENFQDIFGRQIEYKKRELQEIYPIEIVNLINSKFSNLLR